MKKLYSIIFLFFITSCTIPQKTHEFWIQNEQGESIYVRADGLENSPNHKLAIIQHGLASHSDHVAVQAAKKAFLDNRYVVITFDSRYSLGQGNNDVEKVQLKTFKEDLETVIHWAEKQSFYSEPFALAGHSLGGASVIEFSTDYPDKVSVLVPITPVVSGKLWEKSCMKNLTDFCRQWKHNGTYQYTDNQKHKTAIIPYAVLTSCSHYNAYNLAPKIHAKTLFIAAQKDIVVNADDINNLSQLVKNGHVAVIPSSGHNFENPHNQTGLYQAINGFLQY